jgi:hypothetical protein
MRTIHAIFYHRRSWLSIIPSEQFWFRNRAPVELIWFCINRNSRKYILERSKSNIVRMILKTRTIKGERGTDIYMNHVSALPQTMTTQKWPLDFSSPDRRIATFYIHARIRLFCPGAVVLIYQSGRCCSVQLSFLDTSPMSLLERGPTDI